MSAAWSAVAATLADAGCDVVVGLPADEPGLLDGAAGYLRTVAVRDQRVGACLAAGHALVSGRPAAVALTSGPAFPNALAGLAEAASLCVPLVVVTTRIPAPGLGRGGFQETDQRSMAASLAKWHHVVELPAQLGWATRRAVHLAVNGRPGLAIIEIAGEVCEAAEVEPAPAKGPVARLRPAPDPGALALAGETLRTAERPLIILGGGARSAGAGEAALELAERMGAPVMTTAAGRGAVPERHELSMGLVGLYATPPLDRIPAESDVVLAVGTRLEETVRLGWPEAERVRLIHIDVDPHTFGQVIEPEVAIAADAVLALRGLSAALETVVPNATWRERAARADAEASRRSLGPSLVRDAMLAAGDVFGEHATYVHENGLHDIWSYHYPLLPVGDATRVVVPGEQTMLGFGLPAAVGAAMARPETPTLLLCGDGALGMNLPALATAAEQRAGLAVVMFDNEGFGWPRHLRAIEGRPDEITRFSVPFPIADVVRGLGGTVAVARRAEDLRPAIEQARSAALGGGIGLVRVPVRDDDVPPGIARVLADEN